MVNLKLTKRLVESLEPLEEEFFVWDTEIPGLGVRVYPSGARVYVVQARFRGRTLRYRIGRHGAPWTTEQSRQEARRLLGVIAAGNDPANEKPTSLSGMTVERY